MASLARWVCACALVGCAGAGAPAIYIIRHGEKDSVLGCLSARGQARAQNLKKLFGDGLAFRRPSAVFANLYDDPLDCERCIQTVTPLADSLGLLVNSSFSYDFWLGGNSGAAAAFAGTLGALEAAAASCHAAAAGACGGLAEQQCQLCTGKRQHELRAAHCDASALASFCRAGAPLERSAWPALLVAWEHVNIQWLTEDLGAPPPSPALPAPLLCPCQPPSSHLASQGWLRR